MYSKIASVPITPEMDKIIESAVEKRMFRSKSDLMREGITKFLKEVVEVKEQKAKEAGILQ